jgi:hypothetical protein
VDVYKLAGVLTRLAEGDDSAADGLNADERHALDTQFPSVEACRMYIQGLRDGPNPEGGG